MDIVARSILSVGVLRTSLATPVVNNTKRKRRGLTMHLIREIHKKGHAHHSYRRTYSTRKGKVHVKSLQVFGKETIVTSANRLLPGGRRVWWTHV